MSAFTGEIELLQIDTTPESTATYASVEGEISCSCSLANDTVEKGAKSDPKFKGFIKTLIEGNVTLEVEARLTQTGTNLGVSDIMALALLNGTDTNKGERRMKITTATAGGLIISFTGLVLNPSISWTRGEKVNYTFEVKPSGAVTVAEVS